MFQTSSPAAGAAPAPLICIDRIEETADAATFVFRTPDNRPVDYKPGQFIIFQVEVGDECVHRAYSLSSSPSRPESLAVTIKRVPGGKVSNHLLDHLQPGHMLRALPPAGEFNVIDRPSTNRLVLMSAGSGITPCMSIARWLLDTGVAVDIQFIYSARTPADVIMAAELARLDAAHANFTLTRIIDSDPAPGDLQGPIDAALFAQLVPEVAGRTIFTCGPTGYMAALEGFARARGFDMNYFHQESFVPTAPVAAEGEASGETYALQAPQFGKAAAIAASQSLLEVLEAAAVPVVGACRAGVCGSCKCRVVSGEVSSRSQATLSEADIAAGYVLACSTQPRSDLVVEL